MELQYDGRAIPIVFYAMPRVGKPLKITVNGEECEAMTTKWQRYCNTYFLYKNVAMYVREHLPEGAVCRILDLPDNFGAPVKPPHRKSYYKAKPKVVAESASP